MCAFAKSDDCCGDFAATGYTEYFFDEKSGKVCRYVFVFWSTLYPKLFWHLIILGNIFLNHELCIFFGFEKLT